ncbi:MAG: TIGR02391 family protein [Proteobacteria bacterium]|nr:TIGR02391 family protein [Pseudomonadota bacterium]
MIITKRRRAQITVLSKALCPLIPKTTRTTEGFSLQRIAIRTNTLTFFKSEGLNKQKALEHYLTGIIRAYPQKPKNIVIQIVEESASWLSNKHKELTLEMRLNVADAMEALGFNVRKELMEIEQPEFERISIPSGELRYYFERLQIHPLLRADVLDLYMQGHVNDAVRRAAELLEDQVKQRIGPTKNCGIVLMQQAFGGKNPHLKTNAFTTHAERQEQAGFLELCVGTMRSIRNPLSHGNADIILFLTAFKQLCLISYLMETVDESTI